MSKLFERHEDRGVTEQAPATRDALPKLPDDVKVPDDVSTLTHPLSAEERRPADGVRWLRWLPVVVLAIAGLVAAGLILRGDTSDTVVSEPIPWTTVVEGPGSHTLAPSATAPWTTVVEGPGSHTLAPSTTVPWTTVVEGPGSNTLAP